MILIKFIICDSNFRLESAILLNVFNEVEALADDYFDEHVLFYRSLIADTEKLNYRDLAALDMNEENVGKDIWNVFNLPDDLTDLSGYIAKPNEGPSSSGDK